MHMDRISDISGGQIQIDPIKSLKHEQRRNSLSTQNDPGTSNHNDKKQQITIKGH